MIIIPYFLLKQQLGRSMIQKLEKSNEGRREVAYNKGGRF